MYISGRVKICQLNDKTVMSISDFVYYMREICLVAYIWNGMTKPKGRKEKTSCPKTAKNEHM